MHQSSSLSTLGNRITRVPAASGTAAAQAAAMNQSSGQHSASAINLNVRENLNKS